jgi:hypothetical protein
MIQLPKAPSSDAVGEVWHVVGEFMNQLSKRLEGTSDAEGLLQKIRLYQDEFKGAIRATAPHFIPWKQDSRRQDMPDAEFLANEEDEQLMPKTNKIYVDDVLNHAKRYL